MLVGGFTDPDDVMTPLQAAAAHYRIAQGPRAGQKVLSLQLAPRRASGAKAQDGVARWQQPPCDGTDGIHATPGRTGTATAIAPDPLSWGAGTECKAAKGGGAGAAAGGSHPGARRRWRAPVSRERKGAHALGSIAQARVRHRHRALLALWWATEARCGHRRTCRHRPYPHPSGARRPAATACTDRAGGFV